jgi:O-antigen/teichoic acid export membrane protein
LLHLGFRFFIIQISSLIVFATHNLIITQLFSPADVTVYNIAFKYFSIPMLVFGVILSPFWSAYTEAFVKRDFGWIRKVNRRLVQLWILFVVGLLFMLTGANFFYKIWVGTEIQIPSILSVLMTIFTIISMWNNIYAYFLNGVGKIQLQLYNAIVVGILNIPLSILFAKHLNIGVAGVILATIVCLTPSAIWSPRQFHKIVNQTAKGIWNR